MPGPRCSLLILLPGLLLPLGAAVPEKRPAQDYEILWTESPFTNKEIKKEIAPVVPNPVADYTLAGITKLEDGWFVVLLHKKDRTKRIRLSPNGFTESGFRIVSVENPKNRDVRVEIESHGQRGWVQYDPKFLVTRKAQPKQQAVSRDAKFTKLGKQTYLNPRASKIRRVPTPPTPEEEEEKKKKK